MLKSALGTSQDQIEGQINIFDWIPTLNQTTTNSEITIPDDFMNPPVLSPLLNYTDCEHYKDCKCNRYGFDKPIEEYKKALPSGYSCAGCCWYCDAHHNNKCTWKCTYKE